MNEIFFERIAMREKKKTFIEIEISEIQSESKHD